MGDKGDPVASGLQPERSFWGRTSRESEGVKRPMKPGNAGGGMDPCFWYACNGADGRRIGDEPHNPR